MAHPAPSTPATGAIPLPTPILTYLQKYQGQGDVLAGRYHKFLAPYTPDSGRTHAQLEARILSMTAEVPKVFLGLVGHAGVTSSITLHRPTRYASHPVDTSVWDGATLAFAGDVLAGNHIEIVRVPANAFEVAPNNNVPTIAGLQAMLAAQPDAVQFGPFDGTRSLPLSGTWCQFLRPTCTWSWTGHSTRGRSGSKWEVPSSTMGAKRSARHCLTDSATRSRYEKTPVAHLQPYHRGPPSEP